MIHASDLKIEAQRLYVEERLSIRKVASRLGVHPGNVQYWLRPVPLRTKKQAMAGYRSCQDSVEKMRQTKRGSTLKPSHKEAIRSALKGRPKPESFVQHMRTSRRGPANPNYNHSLSDDIRRGLRNRRNIPGYVQWLKTVLLRDGRACVICGSSDRVEAHHKDNFKEYPERRLDVSNGASLCCKHHREIHRKYGRRTTEVQFLEFIKAS